MKKNKVFRLLNKTLIAVVALFGVFIFILCIWLLVSTINSNNKFHAKAENIILHMDLPRGSMLIKDEKYNQGFLDIDNAPTRSLTYKISGYNREQIAEFFKSPESPEQEIKFKKDGVTINIYLFPTPDYGRINDLGREGYYQELASKSVDQFTIYIR